MKPNSPLRLLLQLGLLGYACGCLAQAPAGAKPSGAQLLQMDDGRAGKGNLIATTGVRSLNNAPRSHALIMTIGDYPAPIPKLRGVERDAATAAEIAARLGIPANRIQRLKDEQVSIDGMERALDELEAKLSGDDRVFIYYSGHGGRQVVKDDKGEERCAESLITHDTIGMPDDDLEARLKRIAAKSQKLVVMIDACHSGGVTTRTSTTANAEYIPKAYSAPGQGCSKPSNVITRTLAQAQAPGSGGANFVHIAAARDTEIALDQPGKGGVASQALLTCLSGAASDADGSGGLSVEEVRACAQQRVDQQLAGASGVRPHHITVTGNSAMVLNFGAREAAPALASPPPKTATPSSLATLNDLFNNRDDRYLVNASVPRPQLRIGKDHLDFTVMSREGGHVYVLMTGSDGKSFDLLFPNQLDRSNVLEPGGSMRLPRPSWQISAEGPPGRNTLLIMVSDAPRDFAAAGLAPSGPFSAASALAAKDIQLVTAGGAATPPDAECADPRQIRALAVKKRCSTSYGAALITIDEVQ